MTKQPEPVLVSPMTSKDYFPQYLYGAVVPEHWRHGIKFCAVEVRNCNV